MNVGLYIARRYLFARKSHNVINVISAISAIGMAIGTAALILILSVYNGFDGIIEDNMSDLDPDILITSAEGKYFIPEGKAFDSLLKDDRVESISSILQENVFVAYGDQQGLAKAKGVDSVFEEESALADHIIDGEFKLHLGDVPEAAIGTGLANNMGIRPQFLEQLRLFYPKTGARIPLTSPASALSSVKVAPSGIFSVSSNVDAELVIVPLETMQELLGRGEVVSGVELRLSPEAGKHFKKDLQASLGPDFKALDRYQQNPSLYKMMKYEKLAIFLILIFVVIIVAFNIFGSLSMLIIEKEKDMETLRAMGASDRLTSRIFVFEGWMISLLGLLVGLAAGIGLALLQQKYGLVKMPGGFLVQSYPVILQFGDVVWTAVGVAAVGFFIALLSVSGYKAGRARE